jgi:hypothetical protein
VLAYKGSAISLDERANMITNAGVSALEHAQLERALVIGIDVDSDTAPPSYPYGVLAWVFDQEHQHALDRDSAAMS